jgi:hypothetical protein
VTLTDDIVPLAFIAGPAILANACAILQNGAALRHNLAVAQWRDFHASLVARDERIHALYVDVDRAVRLSERRIRLQLRQTELLLVAACLFGVTSFLALASSLSTSVGAGRTAAATALGMLATGAAGLALLVAASATFYRETTCVRAMLDLHSALDFSRRAP